MSLKDSLIYDSKFKEPTTSSKLGESINKNVLTNIKARSQGVSIDTLVPVGLTGIGESQYDYNIPLASLPNLQQIRANRQSGWDQMANATVRGLASGLATFVEDASYLLDVDNNVRHLVGNEELASNWLADWMKDIKTDLNEALPIYRQRPDKLIDWTDSGFYWDSFAGVLDSAVGFGLTGFGAGAAVKGIGSLLKATSRANSLARGATLMNNIGKALETGWQGQLTTAYLQNFAEGKMMGLETYEQTYNHVLEELNQKFIDEKGREPEGEEALKLAKQASSTAGDAATKMLNWNRFFIATNYLQLNALNRITNRELLKAPGLKNFFTEQVKQAPIEALEEVGQNVIQKEAQFTAEDTLQKALAYNFEKPISTNTDRLQRMFEFASSEQAVLEGLMGLVSGPIQYSITQAPFQDFKGEKARYADQQAKIADFSKTYNERLNKVQDLINEGSTEELDNKLDNLLYDNLVVENIYAGTDRALTNTLTESLENAKSDKEKEWVQSKLNRLKELQGKVEVNDKYANAAKVTALELQTEQLTDFNNSIKAEVHKQETSLSGKLLEWVESYNNKNPEDTITVAQVLESIKQDTEKDEALSLKDLPAKFRQGRLGTIRKTQEFKELKGIYSKLDNNVEAISSLKETLTNETDSRIQVAMQAVNSIEADTKLPIEKKLDKLAELQQYLKKADNEYLNEYVSNTIQTLADTKDKLNKLTAENVEDTQNKTVSNIEQEVVKKTESAAPKSSGATDFAKFAAPNTSEEDRIATDNEDPIEVEQRQARINDKRSKVLENNVYNDEEILSFEDILTADEATLDELLSAKDLEETATAIAKEKVDKELYENKEELEELQQLIKEEREKYVEKVNEIKDKAPKKNDQEAKLKNNKLTKAQVEEVNVKARNIDQNYSEEIVTSNTLTKKANNKNTAKEAQDSIRKNTGKKGVKLTKPSNKKLLEFFHNATNPSGTEVEFEFDESRLTGGTKTAWEKLKAKDNVTRQDLEAFAKIADIKVIFPSLGQDVYAYTHKPDRNNPEDIHKEVNDDEEISAYKAEMNQRIDILMNALKGNKSKGVVEFQYGGELLVEEEQKNILELPDFENAEDIHILFTNQKGKIFSSKDTIKDGDKEVAAPYTEFGSTTVTLEDGTPMGGALFIPIHKMNGELFPLKVNTLPFTEGEVSLIMRIYYEIISNTDKENNVLNQKIPSKYLNRLSDTAITYLGQPTYAEALSYLIYEGNHTTANPATQLYFKNNKVYFGANSIDAQGMVDPEQADIFRNFLISKGRNISISKIRSNPDYKKHILESGYITTDAVIGSNQTVFTQGSTEGMSEEDKKTFRYRKGEMYVSNEVTTAPITQLANSKEQQIADIERRRQEELEALSFDEVTQMKLNAYKQKDQARYIRELINAANKSIEGRTLVDKFDAELKLIDPNATIAERVMARYFLADTRRPYSPAQLSSIEQYIANELSGNYKAYWNDKLRELKKIYDAELAALEKTSTKESNSIEYTPKGKTRQTYKIEGNKIFNKNGKEVFKEDSTDRNKIFANFALKQGRAVVVEHKNNKYIVNDKDQIISVTSGKIMQWGDENGDRRGILIKARPLLKKTSEKTRKSETPVVSSQEKVKTMVEKVTKEDKKITGKIDTSTAESIKEKNNKKVQDILNKCKGINKGKK